ncbi:hypothetical protein TRFO_26933 [Tritrichomonas foetus]|uniref:Copine C-terminal domain-containing protein n=1 Tax=Tritrichomonas foetus TaxID=1144522 RepID=A0A1J4K1J9_9EUKA|nr:hypothetical protein TRFO_26933 [Tritrichomonas foetus]|eukprot:OHT05313.1 hypothetical protein TRFO_26933 [Tritrichomonas foetus]
MKLLILQSVRNYELTIICMISISNSRKQNFGCACAVYTLGTDDVFITESQWKTKTPQFTTKLSIIPKFTDQQQLRFVLLEMTPVIQSIDQYKQIGDVVISLGQILVKGGVEATLMGGIGDVNIEVDQESRGRGVLSMIVAFVSMPKDHWLMKNYPQLVVLKKGQNDEWIPVFSSEVIKRSETGQWAPISLPCRLICDSDYSRQIRLLVQDVQKGNRIKPIGHVDIPVKLVGEARNMRLGLIPADPIVARAGSIIIRAATLIERLTFFGHLKRGLRFNFSCAIDFSANNRPPRDPKSYHYSSHDQKTPYEITIQSIGGVIEQYSDEQICYAWGFGARINRQICHTISLTDESGNSQLRSVHKMLNAYSTLFDKISFDRPIAVCPSMNMALNLVKGKKDPRCYLVHVIMISDDPSDLNQFCDLLYVSQNEALSVIIVGIGDSDFAKTEEKFRPGCPHKNSQGAKFDRDFVSFLKYSDFGQENIPQMISTALYSIPEQAIHWAEVNTI